MTTQTFAPRVVLLGIDAGDASLIRAWMARGLLPNLATLAKRGCFARTTGPELLFEHGAWISLFSGVSRSEHGFHFFRQPVRASYHLELVSGAQLNVAPLWVSLPSSIRSLIIDAPDIPPLSGVSGRQLAEWATHSHYPPIPLRASSPSLLQQAARLTGAREVIAEEISASISRDREIVSKLVARVARKGALIRGLMASEPAELVVGVFAESHTGGHQAWEYRRDARGDGPRDDSVLATGLLEIYQAIDREVGQIIDTVPSSTTVMVVGSIGLRSQYPTEELAENVCRVLGYQHAPTATAAPSLSPLSWLRRLLPQSVRTLMSRALPLERRAQLESDKFVGATDWQRTRAYAMPGYYNSAIRLNLKGREPQGIVAPEDASALCDQIAKDFLALRHSTTNEPVVERVVRVRDDDVYGPDAHHALPDLLVIWREHEAPILSVRHGDVEIRQSPHAFHRGSDHSTEGFVIAGGGDIVARGEVSEVSPLAIAPSVLRVLGVDAPARMRTPPLDW